MKQIDAFWEKRNLGVSTIEIVVEENDSTASFETIADTLHQTPYLVVKVPVARYDIYQYLCSKGFAYIESSINVQLQVKNAFLNHLQMRLNKSISHEIMNDTDVSQLFDEIAKGLFVSDRIAMDPYFSAKQAATRYINWIGDEIERGTQVYKIVYKEDAIGFFTFKHTKDQVYYPFLGAMYAKYSQSGLGFEVIRKPIEEALLRGGEHISTFVSSNNPAVIRAHTQQGYSIHEIQNVFIKHNS